MSAAHAVDRAGGCGVAGAAPGEDAAALMIDARGMICDCNDVGEALFGYRRSQLVWRHVSMLLPQLAGVEPVQNGQPNPRLRFLCRIGRHFLTVTQGGERFASNLFLNLLDNSGRSRLSLIVRRAATPAGDEEQNCVVPTHGRFT